MAIPDSSVLDVDIRLLHSIVVYHVTPFDVQSVLCTLQNDGKERNIIETTCHYGFAMLSMRLIRIWLINFLWCFPLNLWKLT